MTDTIGRRGLAIRLGGLGAVGLFGGVHAQTQPATIGTFPEGVGADSVFVGITVPLTGPYAADGQDLQRGYELALALVNGGDPAAAKWGLNGKGVLGKQVRHRFADSETKPTVAVQAQTQFIQRDKAILVTGSVSSAVAIAVQELASREHVLNMVGVSGSNDTTGKNCNRWGFRSQQQSYMAAKAIAPIAAKTLGTGKKAAYLVPDYTYGQSVFDSTSEFMKQHGWTVASKQVVPLGAPDYSSALLNIANSGADVFVNVAFAQDAVTATKQAEQFGVLKRMKMIVPNLSAYQAQELGPKLMEGVLGSFEWHWKLQDRYPLSKDFVTAFRAKFDRYPTWAGACGLHADHAVGRRRGAGEGLPPDRHHQDVRGQQEPAVRQQPGQGVVSRGGPPDGPPRAHRDGPQGQRGEGQERRLRHPGRRGRRGLHQPAGRAGLQAGAVHLILAAVMPAAFHKASVMPAQAGIHDFGRTKVVDARLRGHDGCARASYPERSVT